MPNKKLLLFAREIRNRAVEALARAESFQDPEARRIMRELAVSYEKLARRLEMEAGET